MSSRMWYRLLKGLNSEAGRKVPSERNLQHSWMASWTRFPGVGSLDGSFGAAKLPRRLLLSFRLSLREKLLVM